MCNKAKLLFTWPTCIGRGDKAVYFFLAHFAVLMDFFRCPGIRYDATTGKFISGGNGQFERHPTDRMISASMNIFLFIWHAALVAEKKTQAELPFETFLEKFLFIELSGVAAVATAGGVFVDTEGNQVAAEIVAKIKTANRKFNTLLLASVAREQQRTLKNTIIDCICFCKGINSEHRQMIASANALLRTWKSTMSLLTANKDTSLAALCTLIGTTGGNLTTTKNLADATTGLFNYLYRGRKDIKIEDFCPFKMFEKLAEVLRNMHLDYLEHAREVKARARRIANQTEEGYYTRHERLSCLLGQGTRIGVENGKGKTNSIGKGMGKAMGKAIGDRTNTGTTAAETARNQKRTNSPCKCQRAECKVIFSKTKASDDARLYYASKEGKKCADAVRQLNPNDKWLRPLYDCPFKRTRCQLYHKQYPCSGCKKKATGGAKKSTAKKKKKKKK